MDDEIVVEGWDAVQDYSDLIADNQNDPRLIEPGQHVEDAESDFIADATMTMDDSVGQDVLDLADILNGSPGSDNIDGYLLAINNGESSTLLVDTQGTGNFTNPDLVIEVAGVNWDSSVAGQLASLVDDAVIVVI